MPSARLLRLAVFAAGLVALAPVAALAAPVRTYEPLCSGPGRRCFARIAKDDGRNVHAFAPGLGNISAHTPAQLQRMYHVDPTRGAGMTVAVIDAYGYATLEADLGMYRAKFDLPPCTVATGCLRIVNVDGDSTNLPTNHDDGWNVETALDIDMVSAGCPLCKILVVLVNEPSDDLDTANATAARLGADAISNSWGSHEGGDASFDSIFDQTGVGIFVSSGDNGFAAGPQYPATSPHVIAVGGTRVVDNIPAHTSLEGAWSLAGSSCSTEFSAPAFQPVEAACPRRAASDVAAVADPATGVGIYSTPAGGYSAVGGTSAASPLVAAIMAASGHADASPAFVYRHPEAFSDVTSGANGTCNTTLCNAGSGWDGPTGLGTPNQDVLASIGAGAGPAVAITAPADGSTQTAAFSVAATVADGAAHVDLRIDGLRVVGLASGPYTFSAPALGPGTHVVTVAAYTADHDTASAQITVVVPQPPAPDAGVIDVPDGGASGSNGSTGGGGGCATTGGSGGVILVAGVAVLALRRRRRAARIRLP